MSDLDPSTQPRVASLPALVEALPAQPAASPESTFTRERQVEFLHALAATGAVRPAVARAGVSHQTAYRERLASPLFRRAWDAALLAARCHAEETLACRAIDGVEEQVWYHGEVVATRRRHDARLLLAHLARLDRLTGDARVEAFAGDFEAALDRFGQGSDAPEAPPPNAPNKKPPGQWSKRSTAPAIKECPECGGKCLGPEDALTEADCQWLGNRLERMDEARPRGELEPHQFRGYDRGEVEAEQLAAFEAGEGDWWLIIPPGPDDDPDVWHFADDQPPIEYKSLNPPHDVRRGTIRRMVEGARPRPHRFGRRGPPPPPSAVPLPVPGRIYAPAPCQPCQPYGLASPGAEAHLAHSAEKQGRVAMKSMLPIAALAIAVAAVPALAVDGSSAESGRKLSTTLTGAAEIPGPGDPDGGGSGDVRVNPGQGSVCFKVTYSGIDAPNAAHIHSGAATVAGPVVVNLGTAPGGGTIEGCTGVTRELAMALIQNPEAFYINVHNAGFPAGAIRGQLDK